MIKMLKKGNDIYLNFEENSEDGVEICNIPQDLEEFKVMAIDTINWQIGDSVKKASGGTQTNLSASNAKAIVLNSKKIDLILKHLDLELDNSFSDLEKDSSNKMVALGNNGYADSQLLNVSLSSVSKFITKGTDKATRVINATTHEEVIAILNED